VFFNWEEDKEFKASDLKNLLREMPIIDDQSKLYFRQLLSFYLVDQVLVCSGNSKKLNPKSWGAVQDLHAFEKINWAKIVFEHICDSLKHLKGQMCHSGQHVFKGFAPVVEVCFAQPFFHNFNNFTLWSIFLYTSLTSDIMLGNCV
jgi:hypothetical protein